MLTLRALFSPPLLCFCAAAPAFAEDGYDLWMRYREIAEPALRERYREQISGVLVDGPSSATLTAARRELTDGLSGLLGQNIPAAESVSSDGLIVAGTPHGSRIIKEMGLEKRLRETGDEGFLIQSKKIGGRPATVIASNTDIGVLYGAFHFLRLLQTHQDISHLDIASTPKIQRRILNHWDNLTPQPLTGSIERGYAGDTLWKWSELPATVDPRMVDYARANASLGINGAVLNNVNTDPHILTDKYLRKAAALADAFRPYGVRVYLSARFSSPKEIGGLATADPLDPAVIDWWGQTAARIYKLIPDFGGFLVKADCEGQPGPQDYGRTHADGANMLARALAPHGGIVMWRAFVYGFDLDPDRVKQAHQVFLPFDAKFDPNVLVQVKNGPLDFQPREPVHPLFGSMPRTNLMMEFQITQEYLGHSQFLAYLAPMWREILDFDTFASGRGSTVARVVESSGIAGVANTGSDRNWCGHHFAQANWYAFGRLAWDHELAATDIAAEWARMTFGNEKSVVSAVVAMAMNSYEGVVDAMTPLGLNVLCEVSHYGPAPQDRPAYHHADATGIGADRTRNGSGAVDQYHAPLSDLFNNPATCPEKYLLWFHHLPWDHPLKSGRTLWDELCYRYQRGAETARSQRATWEGLQDKIDPQRFREVADRLKTQEADAARWRDACLEYFQEFSQRPIPPFEEAASGR